MTVKTALICLVLYCAGLTENRAMAQTESPYADENRPAINDTRPAATGFFWMTETNYKPARETIVRFYDPQKRLIYEEKLADRCLNVRRKRVVKSLNRALAEVRGQWVMRSTIQQPDYFVANQLRR